MKVIDISSWQENVDWDAVVAEGIEGVIIKIGERSTLDEMFIEHVNAAVAHGLKYGIYYYAHACTRDEAICEAEQVNEWVQEYLAGATPELGIWYDAESERMTSGDVTDTCAAFLNRMTDFGYTYIGIYASLMHKKCAVCGKHADLHHCEGGVVGMGNDRTKVNHIGRPALPLCREHLTVIHQVGQADFLSKYHLVTIPIDKKIAKVYRLKAGDKHASNTRTEN